MRLGVYFFVILTAIASIGFNAYFGYTIGQHSGEFFGIHNGYVYPFVFGIVDVIKIAIPVMLAVILFSSVQKIWKGVASLIGVALFLGMTAVSLSGIFGSFATDRDNMSAQRSVQAKQYSDLSAEKDAIMAGNPYRQIRSPEAIQSDIDGYKSAPDNRWTPTNGCDPSSITITQSRMWCQEYHRLVGQREEAKQVLADRERLREINGALASMPGAIESDPQARRMGDMLGITPDQYVTGLITILAFLIEFTASLMPVVIYVYGQAKSDHSAITSDAAETLTDACPQENDQGEAYRIILDAWERQKALKGSECPVELALHEHRRDNPEEADAISYPNLSNRVNRILMQRGQAPWRHKLIGTRMAELGCKKSITGDKGGSVTYYDLSGLGGAQKSLAHAA